MSDLHQSKKRRHLVKTYNSFKKVDIGPVYTKFKNICSVKTRLNNGKHKTALHWHKKCCHIWFTLVPYESGLYETKKYRHSFTDGSIGLGLTNVKNCRYRSSLHQSKVQSQVRFILELVRQTLVIFIAESVSIYPEYGFFFKFSPFAVYRYH